MFMDSWEECHTGRRVLKAWRALSVVAPISALKTSDGILSIPGALCNFSFLIALLISSLDILPQLMLRSSVVSSMSGIESGGGLFKISWTYSFQRCNCRDSLVRKLDSESELMPLSSLHYTIVVLKLNLVLYLSFCLPPHHTRARTRTHTHPPSLLPQGIFRKCTFMHYIFRMATYRDSTSTNRLTLLLVGHSFVHRMQQQVCWKYKHCCVAGPYKHCCTAVKIQTLLCCYTCWTLQTLLHCCGITNIAVPAIIAILYIYRTLRTLLHCAGMDL